MAFKIEHKHLELFNILSKHHITSHDIYYIELVHNYAPKGEYNSSEIVIVANYIKEVYMEIEDHSITEDQVAQAVCANYADGKHLTPAQFLARYIDYEVVF